MSKRPKRLVIISCRAPLDLRERLERLARRERRSASNYLRLLLEDVLTARVFDDRGKKKGPRERRSKAAA